MNSDPNISFDVTALSLGIGLSRGLKSILNITLSLKYTIVILAAYHIIAAEPALSAKSVNPNIAQITSLPTYLHHSSEEVLGLFDDVMKLIRDKYVTRIDEQHLFRNILEEITLKLVPNCLEAIDINETSCLNYESFRQMLNRIKLNCRIRIDRLALGAINSVVQSLDVNSSLMDSDMIKELKIGTSGKFGGVGMVVNPKEGQYVVVSPFEGSPAYHAGIKAGDTIIEIDGKPIVGLPLSEVLRKVRGPAGSVISVKIREARTGKIRQIRLQRRTIHISPVRYSKLASGIWYLRIVNFQQTAPKEVQKALEHIYRSSRQDLKGIVIDLRNNPGGLFDQAIEVADLFISSGIITSVIGPNSGLNRVFMASGNKRPEVPLVVLINRGTASASEILAGSLQGRKQVIVMGERTFGKASVQAVFPLRQGLALRITTAHYYTADGRNIDGTGLEPDVILTESSEEFQEKIDVLKPDQLNSDPWIQKAVLYLHSGQLEKESSFGNLF